MLNVDFVTHFTSGAEYLWESQAEEFLRRIPELYSDKGISGTKDRAGRPALDRMMRDIAQGRVDVVMSWALDRLGRSLYHVVTMMAELQQQGVGLYLHKQAIDSTTAAGKAMLGMAAVLAEFERDMLWHRPPGAQGERSVIYLHICRSVTPAG